ncbi:hypothetical protein LPB140_07280 [Sphingorhabdus lutea]|uniref:Uncharacterized protein n=1 Tax=Sphingorhabdus lutea TaxID=1913578 RepID=A0A1L3JBX0_9SPHN|nr:hypothetical protein LPB140_07280 [Sphingorhabdus lutea]
MAQALIIKISLLPYCGYDATVYSQNLSNLCLLLEILTNKMDECSYQFSTIDGKVRFREMGALMYSIMAPFQFMLL